MKDRINPVFFFGSYYQKSNINDKDSKISYWIRTEIIVRTVDSTKTLKGGFFMKKRQVLALLMACTLALQTAPVYAAPASTSIETVSKTSDIRGNVEEVIKDMDPSTDDAIKKAGFEKVNVTSKDDLNCGDIMVTEDIQGNRKVYAFVSYNDSIMIKEKNGFEDVSFTFDEDATFFRFVQLDPEYTSPTGIKTEYGTKLSEIKLPEHFTWQEKNQTLSEIKTNKFHVIYTPENTVKYKIVKDIEIEVEVGKKQITTIGVPSTNLEITYAESTKLKDIELPDKWSWKDPSIVPTCNVSEYIAVYTPTEEDLSHYDYSGASLEHAFQINVSKADMIIKNDYTFHVNLGKKLNDISLPIHAKGTYSWQEEETVFNELGDTTCYLTFIPSNSNYNIITNIPVKIIVENKEPEYTIPQGLTVSYGGKLEDIILPEGFTWDNPKLSVGTPGEKTFTATFTPEDLANFGKVSVQIPVTVEKSKAPHVASPSAVMREWTDGLALKDITLTKGWSFENENQIPGAGTHSYNIVYTPDDTDFYDYSDQSLTRSIKVTINKVNPRYTKPKTITVDSGTKLSDSLLPSADNGKFVWQVTPTVTESGAYPCSFVPNDEHYNTVTSILVTINVVAPVTPDPIPSEPVTSPSVDNEENSSPSTKPSENTTTDTATDNNSGTASSVGTGNSVSSSTTTNTAPSTAISPTFSTRYNVNSSNGGTVSASNKTQSDITVEEKKDTSTTKVRPTVVSENDEKDTVKERSNSSVSKNTTKNKKATKEKSSDAKATTKKETEKSKNNVPIIGGFIVLVAAAGFGIFKFLKRRSNK